MAKRNTTEGQVNFSFRTRQGMTAAIAIAEEIENNSMWGKPFGTHKEREVRPVFLSTNKDTFRFEGGIVIRVDLVNTRDDRQEWVVTGAEIRYYKLDSSGRPTSKDKEEELWDHEKLAALKELRWWHHPNVMSATEIKDKE